MTDSTAADKAPVPSEGPGAPLASPAAHAPTARTSGWAWFALLLALAAAGAWLWYSDHQRAERELASRIAAEQKVEALNNRVEGLRRDVRSHSQRLQQADATNRVLRDELLGMGQRAAVIEDQVAKLADANRHGAQALRLDEAELLLTLGEQRLVLAADLEGARHAYALAAGVLDGVDTPGALNLRQALAQERAALQALDAEPRRAALQRLDALTAQMPAIDAPPSDVGIAPRAPWWERALSRLVSVRRSDAPQTLASADRRSGEIALQLEFALARTAIERGDAQAMRAALARADGWLLRLWPPSAQRQQLREGLRALRNAPLKPDLPTLGSTLAQLRAMRSD